MSLTRRVERSRNQMPCIGLRSRLIQLLDGTRGVAERVGRPGPFRRPIAQFGAELAYMGGSNPMIDFNCVGCGKTYRVNYEFSGRATTCRQCGQAIVVPPPMAIPLFKNVEGEGKATELSQLVNQAVRQTIQPTPTTEKGTASLISCGTCGNRIATTAKSCPKCGAVNSWVHPEIERFLASIDHFSKIRSFTFDHDGLVLNGIAEVIRGGKALWVIATIAYLFAFLNVFFLAFESSLRLVILATFLRHCRAVFYPVKSRDGLVRFCIDFNQNPPSWSSDDDSYWRDVRRFFFP